MQPSWANEFLHFSSAQRGTHRRSASDTVAFLELPAAEDKGAFDFDDYQLMSIFSDDVGGEPLPEIIEKEVLDQNSVDEKKKGEMTAESQSKREAEKKATPELALDPKRVKRILANRQSAQRSRVRKLQYISELERNVTYLQTEVSALSPRVAFLDHQRSALTFSNSALRQRIAALAQDKIFKDGHQEALKKEIERLSQIYHHQSLKMMASNGTTPTTLTITGTAPIDPVSYIEKDQLVS